MCAKNNEYHGLRDFLYGAKNRIVKKSDRNRTEAFKMWRWRKWNSTERTRNQCIDVPTDSWILNEN